LLGVASSAAGDPYTFDFAQTTQTWQSSAPAVIKHVLFSACLALLMLLGMAFYFHQGTIRNNAETSTLQAKADALEQEILALGEKGLGSDVDARVFSDPTLLTILDEISKKMPGDKVNITEVKISPPEAKSWWMRIQGTVADAGVFNEVFNAMKGSQLFTVQDEPDLSLQGELTTFAVKMFRPDEAAAEGDAAGNETGALAAKETGSENQS